eukprot:GHVP01057509.1.p1 GENE.GHVP01057509.1~~GHVP01057509.1.p1  ORF type:complete len:175 (-),score=18.25 GHVP01057509.1:591-1115(-)
MINLMLKSLSYLYFQIPIVQPDASQLEFPSFLILAKSNFFDKDPSFNVKGPFYRHFFSTISEKGCSSTQSYYRDDYQQYRYQQRRQANSSSQQPLQDASHSAGSSQYMNPDDEDATSSSHKKQRCDTPAVGSNFPAIFTSDKERTSNFATPSLIPIPKPLASTTSVESSSRIQT